MFEAIAGMVLFCLVAALLVTGIDRLFNRTPTFNQVIQLHKPNAKGGELIYSLAEDEPAYGRGEAEVSTEDSRTLSMMDVRAPRLNVIAVQDSKGPPPWATLGKEWMSEEERTANNPAPWIKSDVEIEMLMES